MASNSGYRIPATQLYIVVNSGLQPTFAVVDRSTPAILAQTVGMAVKVDMRLMLDRAYRRGEEQRRRLQRRRHSGKLQCAEPRRHSIRIT